ncbi:MAG TPA: hypothetical protein PLV55_13420, partial [Anaerohalosphaeraceae bacterium]|nr:hypothetical protein [Anaerohalosphaeraceae bacterium]
MKKKVLLFSVLAVVFLALGAGFVFSQRTCPWISEKQKTPQSPSQVRKPKVLVIDSYHKGYPWSEGILEGIRNVFKASLLEDDTFDCSASPVLLRLERMDTKRNQSESFKVQAGLKVKEVIDSWKPDLVIAADDNASAYVIAPFYRNTDLPAVFCGVNWEASAYGFPCRNVTGMIEVDLVESMVQTMQKYAAGSRLVTLGADNESNRKAVDNYIRQAGLTIAEKVFVENLEQFKKAYLDLQSRADMLILTPPSFLTASEEDQQEARRFVLENTKIITGSVESWIAPYTV